MPDTNQATATSCTPRSNSEEQAQLKAAKDKNCPFCGQAFTSSSLGRHLDLYIRPKNPKAEDGVHIAEEIRKIRGNITRRHAKGSSLKEKLRTPAADGKESLTGDASPVIVQSPVEHDDSSLVSAKPRQRFKDVSWQAAGTPDGQSRRALGAKTPEVRREASRQMQKVELDQRQKVTDDADTVKATEMALKELLKSVQEAKYVCLQHT